MSEVSSTPRKSWRKSSWRLYPWIARRLSHPRAQRHILLLSLALMLPSLDTGLVADDYVHQLMLDGSPGFAGFVRSPLDIFRFCGPTYSPLLVRDGVFTWWDDMHTRIAFMRPVSALTHWVDHALWHDAAWMAHLHCWLWGVILLLGVRTLYRELIPDRFLATLAFALYALDDARSWFVSLVAARNAVVATAFSAWALVWYHRRRAGAPAFAGGLALVFTACGLLAGEGAIATYGYILASALFLESGPLLQRGLRLWPYAVLLVAWRIAYRALDYGVYGSALYVDPLHGPVAFLKLLAEHGPILLQAQLGGMWSDLWTSFFMFPKLRVLVFIASLVAVALAGLLLAAPAKREPLVRYGLLGALLAVLPASAVFPADRLLTWVAIGASIAMAYLLQPHLRAVADFPRSAWLTRLTPAIVAWLVLTNLVVAPMLLASRSRGAIALRDPIERADRSIPSDPSITGKTLVFINVPAVPMASYIPITRAALGVPRAQSQRILATATTALTVTRTGERSVRLAPGVDFFTNPASRLLWDETRVFQVGEEIPQGECVVRVTKVTPEHLPLEVEVTFEKPLEDPSYVWLQWHNTQFAPFLPPRPGEQVVLPAAEYMQVVLGKKLPFQAYY